MAVTEPTELYWFTPYTFGWKPVAWQGWVIVTLYIFALVYAFFQINNTSPSVGDTLLNFLPQFILFSLFLLFICIQTGQPIKGERK